jgi:hypothetical protein
VEELRRKGQLTYETCANPWNPRGLACRFQVQPSTGQVAGWIIALVSLVFDPATVDGRLRQKGIAYK